MTYRDIISMSETSADPAAMQLLAAVQPDHDPPPPPPPEKPWWEIFWDWL